MNNTTYKITIAEKIRAYRTEKKLSQGNFGRLFGVSAQAVSKWEADTCCPDIVLLPQLAAALGCRVDDFFKSKELL